MDMHIVRTISGVLVAVALLLPAAAHAATPAQIHADAADGMIDGDYSMAELRKADEAVSPEMREYYGWEEAYDEHLRGMSQLPTAVPSEARAPVPARGTVGRDAVGREKTRSHAAGDSSTSSTPPAQPVDPASSASDEPQPSPSADSRDDAPAEAREVDAAAAEPLPVDDGSGGFPFVFLLLAVPLIVLGVGVCRLVRQRAAGWRLERAAVDE